jgi:malonate transporter MadM subunit
MVEGITKVIHDNGLVFAFFLVGIIMLLSHVISKNLTSKKIPTPAIAILIGLILAYVGGMYTEGKKGIADVDLLAGFGIMGNSMFRDFAIVATAIGASLPVMKKAGWLGALSLIVGIVVSFFFGAVIAMLWGYRDVISITTMGAGACTYIVGPVTGAALGASSDIVALSIAAGVVKAIVVAIGTPLLAKLIGLDNPRTAMIYGGMMGTNAGVMAGLAATDPKLVPYGAITATFYTGLGCLLCPSVFYLILRLLLPA